MSIVSFLRGSRRRYDQPRYALIICLCAALVCIFLVAFSAPMTDAIYLVKLTVRPADLVDVVVVLGPLGYCWERSGVEGCSQVGAAYQLGREIALPSPIGLPSIPTWSTTVICLQVVTFAVTSIACTIIISAHFVQTYFARWPLVYCGIAAVMQLACYIFDDILFSVTRSAMDQNSTIKLGNGTWLAMAAFFLLCSAIVGDLIQLRVRPTLRNTEKTHIITPYTVSDVESGRKCDTTARADVLGLIPANERRSLDQHTIDVILQSLLEDATPTSPITTATASSSQASSISQVSNNNNANMPQAAGLGQSAPNINPIANPNPTLPNMATTLPDIVVTRQVPLGPREARVPALHPALPPLAPVRQKVTISRYAPSSYYTYQSRRTSDSEQTVSTRTTSFPRSPTSGFLSRATTMRSGVLPPMSERHTSTPSMSTPSSTTDFQLPRFAHSTVGSTSTLSSTWNSLFQKLAPSNPQTPPLPHFPMSSDRFGGDRFIQGAVSDDAWSVASAVQSSDLEHSSDISDFNYPTLLDVRHPGPDGRHRRLV